MQCLDNGHGMERYSTIKKDGDKNHKILKFPILRASVKSYKNNLNTHKSYKKFRAIRFDLRNKTEKSTGLSLTAHFR